MDEGLKTHPVRLSLAQIVTTGLVAAIISAAMALLIYGALAEQKNGSSLGIPTPLLPSVAAEHQRIRVDPNVLPWRAVGMLQAASVNLREQCTAVLVGQSALVTAAHCLFNRRTQRNFLPGSLHFLIGVSGSGYAGHATGVKVNIAGGYDPRRSNETIGSDWALVSLDKSLGSPDRVLPIVSNLPENGAKVMLGGYQRDHPLVLMADVQCRIVGRFVDASGDSLLRHNCSGTNGVSGAPLLFERDGGWQIAAIAVGGEMGIAGGTAVPLDLAVKALREKAERPTGDQVTRSGMH